MFSVMVTHYTTVFRQLQVTSESPTVNSLSLTVNSLSIHCQPTVNLLSKESPTVKGVTYRQPAVKGVTHCQRSHPTVNPLSKESPTVKGVTCYQRSCPLPKESPTVKGVTPCQRSRPLPKESPYCQPTVKGVTHCQRSRLLSKESPTAKESPYCQPTVKGVAYCQRSRPLPKPYCQPTVKGVTCYQRSCPLPKESPTVNSLVAFLGPPMNWSLGKNDPCPLCTKCTEDVQHHIHEFHKAPTHLFETAISPPTDWYELGKKNPCPLCTKCTEDVQRHIREFHKAPIRGFKTAKSSAKDPLVHCEVCQRTHRQTNAYRCRRTSSKSPQYILDYLKRAQAAKDRAEIQVQDLERKCKDGTRLAYVLPECSEILRCSEVGEAITCKEYFQLLAEGELNRPSQKYVICSPKEAKMILEKGPPRLPILVPAELHRNSRDHLELEKYLKVLETRRELHVHDFDSRNRDPIPEIIPAQSATARLRDKDSVPINIVHLSNYKKNPIPTFLQDQDNYHLIDSIREQEGKRDKVFFDLAESAAFQLLASSGAWTSPHIDHHAKMTVVTLECGEKIWNVWPGLSLEDLEQNLISSHFPEDPIALYLRKGDIFIQPSTTLHGVFTMVTSLVTGSMHLHPKSIRPSLEQTLFELKNRGITNEDVSKHFVPFMEYILSVWEAREGPYDWDDMKEIQPCREILRAIKGPQKTKTKRRPETRRKAETNRKAETKRKRSVAEGGSYSLLLPS
ncbi:hypothetical protein EDB81DRAFT_768533 [Dactylonectria macrodidyma]|uniref:JmjC domain-containing protein n=1 Tax=Dactylonectria macrodidyma TaxID=307937 RepID=A0A9P9I988_9HYPO|nr:hypothetical protein EDB81DRAFT_768533 [Dactylonectria macrodidyma]